MRTKNSYAYPLILTFFFLFVASGVFAQPTLNSVQDGDWGVNSTWDGNAPGCNVNQDIVITDTVTCNCDPLDIQGTGSITIKNGGHLIVESNTGLTGNGDLTVESDGSILVKGDMDIDGNGDFQLDGEATVQGDFDRGGSGTADGNGDLTIGGCCCSPDWQGDQSNCDEGVPLPVELISFKGYMDNGSVRLHWRTASEKNCSHFIVQERSENGTYQKLGRVEGSGTSVSGTEYRFTDAIASEGTYSYYRLVQVDLDGDRTQYGPVSVRTEGSSEELQLFPNPMEDEAYLQLPEDLSQRVQLSVRDLSGRLLFQKEMDRAFDGRLRLSREELGLDRGTYLLSLRSGSGEKLDTEQLIVQ